MKIAIINTMQSGGGAAIAAMRLFKALTKGGVDATFIAASGNGGEGVVTLSENIFGRVRYRVNFLIERLVIWVNNRFSRRNLFAVSIANTGFDVTKIKAVQEADVIHLHWINQGLLSVEGIKKVIALGKPVVITAHDMWYCTAICHHSLGCRRFTSECQYCALLAAPSENDLSACVWRRKVGMFTPEVTFVALSAWINRQLESSAITCNAKTVVIPNSIDTSIFYPMDRAYEREKRGIGDNEKVIIFGAAKLNDPIKGAEILFHAISECKYREEITLVIFGNIKGDDDFINRIPCKHIYAGVIKDPSEQAGWYAASDIAAVPSHYETFGQVITEAIACGIPTVAFDSAGQCDIIEHKINGYLAKYPDIADFAAGIEWLFDNVDNRMRSYAVDSVKQRFSPEYVASQHIKLYEELLKSKKHG